VSVLDVATVKEQQRATWDGVSPGWAEFGELFERGAAVVTARLVELAGLRPGAAVLDVGCGQGEPALAAAEAVEPGGRVLGIDLSPRMVAAARRRAGGRVWPDGPPGRSAAPGAFPSPYEYSS
jgi:SAM-dependent methyltransferase